MPLLLYNVVRVINWLIYLITTLIVIRALISWLPLPEGSKFVSFLNIMTEPVMAPIRSLLWKIRFINELPIDFSPLIAILLLYFIKDILNILVSFAL